MGHRLTLSMIVHNEAHRHLREVLRSAAKYVDDAVIIDDASSDETIPVIAEELERIPYRIVHNKESKFANEVDLRRQQWEETFASDPEWILTLDADEVFEKSFVENVKSMLDSASSDAFYFRLYDMWSETHYRDDRFWSAHNYYRPFLVRALFRDWTWKETSQHCGRFPIEVHDLSYTCSPYRLRHLGWSRAEDRAAKYERYMRLDPEGIHGWIDQYKSILDPNPNLAAWVE
jgi:glycosyltransferase involved in cell wall biosynthesis